MGSEHTREQDEHEGEISPESRPINRRMMIITTINLGVIAASSMLIMDTRRKLTPAGSLQLANVFPATGLLSHARLERDLIGYIAGGGE